jgi:hypothetical protein
MKRLGLLLALLVAACAELPPPPPGGPPSPVRYSLVNNGLIGCQTWGFETICRNP